MWAAAGCWGTAAKPTGSRSNPQGVAVKGGQGAQERLPHAALPACLCCLCALGALASLFLPPGAGMCARSTLR